jgi:Mg-chelatase subunit ChlD
LSNNSTSATCTVYEKNSILFLDKKHRGGLFVKLLKDMGFTVQIAEPKALPQDLQVFSCVLLHDLPASDIPEWFQQKIRDYVFQGGGFGFLGGPDSFGAGGYFKSTIEEISPVFMPPRSYKQSLAIVLLIDSSGSMLANDSKITSSQDLLNLFLKNKNNLKNSPILAAQKAAIAVLEDLVAVDVAVVSFNEKARLAVPLQTVHEDNLEDIRSQIYTISAGGGTRFYPALTGAESLIKDQGYKEVHFLLLSDGQPEDKDFVDSAIELLKGDQITLSTIAFGQEAARGLLRKMAEQTGGQFFASHHVATLRSTFKKAVEKVFGPPVILESRNTKFSEGQSIVREKKATPKVLGLMSTAPKKRSQNIIITESGEPLLSIGNFGSGKCFVWTSDITGKWSHFWLTSPSMKSIMGTVLAAVSNNSSKPFTIRTEQKGNVLTVMLTALNEQGEFIDDLSVSSYLHNTETDESYSIPILYEGSGEYRGEISLSDKSATELNIDVNLGTQNWSEKFKLSPPSNPEFSSSKANSALFEQLEQQRENSIISSPEQIQSILNTYQPKIYTEQESLVIPLYAFLIFLLFLDVLFRRFRVYEALEEQNRKQSTPEKRWEKLADYHWKKARALLKEGELKNAENSFLSAHKYYIDAKKQDKAADVWQEYTIKIK